MVVPEAQERWGKPRVVDTRSRKKRCQPFSYDSPGTLERGTQWYFLRVSDKEEQVTAFFSHT